ncbi:Enhancer of mRNA-decapping protein 3 [Fulvia fulva]|uniref:Enhancer of mRNA-decapping protein 3 n=1 Tax=Passalora fulva TaxID=5499 RepID=A0A9Q8LBZ6_PASFU|nr:Enhancer of mRNA-decapping protein 3 [Fulvia fulva]KAK4633119.1 Enhancer of mRNA-decapping protein 3 [Fulvia fulva]UJO14584.1 Enhancer of mRNA-decapping protein 3 [Fulvia fulva]WPV11390.1 Enhancer of mRNA-decapping protein 3 [Fulvia fulva]
MANPVGLTVCVKLQQATNNIVYGVVHEIVPNSHLTLHNVVFPGSSTRFDHWTVQASAISDLQVVQPEAVPHPPPAHIPIQSPSLPYPPSSNNHHSPYPPPPGFGSPAMHQQQLPQPPFAPQSAPAPIQQIMAEVNGGGRQPPAPTELPSARPPTPTRSSATFVDPAILSYGNASPVQKRAASRSEEMHTPVKSMLARAAQNLPSPGSPFIGDITKANVAQKLAAAGRKQSGASPQPPAVPIASKPVENMLPTSTAQDASQPELNGKKKIRRGQKSKKQPATPGEAADPPPVMNSEVSRNGNNMSGAVRRGKGWRSTPLLQQTQATASPSDQTNPKKSRRRQKEEMEVLGDTTGIEDMGDFDFEGELRKFDKKQVFDEIRQGDTTADEDRLVSHNRVHRPGTYGGKNLHPTENVLSPKVQPVYNSNELESSSDADTELQLANGRSSSKHSVSRNVFSKTKPSRQNSGQVDVNHARPHPLTASMSSDRNLNRSATSLTNRAKATSLAASSPRPDGERANSPLSAVSKTRPANAVPEPPMDAPYFAIQPQGTACPTLLPKALENLEAATVSTYGLSYDAITENAARAVAEAALHLSELHGGIRRPSRTNTLRGSMTASTTLTNPNELTAVVVLAGNHELGAIAMAAARQLLGRNVKIIAAESLYENADTQDPQAKAQIAMLRRMARGGAKIKRGLWRKASAHIKNLSGPPAVIIDALLAGSSYDSLLSSNAAHSTSAQKETREMIDWANRSRAPVLSIACPTGVSGIDGHSTIVEGEPLAVRPDKVLALGAPMQGLLKACEGGERWDISLADIGINIALKSEEAVAFGGSWTVDLKYVDDDAAA